MSIKQFQQERLKGLPSDAYLFYSTEDFLLYEVLSIIKDKHRDSSGFDFDVFDMKSPDDSRSMVQIIDILNTLPFSSGRKVVVIENIQKASKVEIKKLEGYLANPSSRSLLVMLCSGRPRPFNTTVLKNVKTIALTIYEREIPLWVKDRAERKGISLTDRAVEYLISLAGTDLWMLYSEVEKISSWSAGGTIDIDDIKNTVYAGIEYNAFDLVNALKKRDAKEVFRIFETVNRNTESQMLLGALNWQYTSLATEFSHNKEGRYLEEILGLLHQADVAIKNSHSHVIEELLIKLLNNSRTR
ncbi:DNA polymerase III subunit delta [Thermodesulfovibrionales bacterium]|nr:DNA polymerase III subunit delta [Thermodesulfovibrionales bacterium]